MALFTQVGFLPRVLFKEVLLTDDLRSGHIITSSSPLELLCSELPNDLNICLHFLNYSLEKLGTRETYSHKLKDESYLVKKLL